MYKLIIAFLFVQQICYSQNTEFKFAFLTDIHLNNKAENCFQGFEKAIEHAKTNEAQFIITGGDNVDIDVLGNKKEEAEELYNKFKNTLDKSEIDIYPTMGNHDRYKGADQDDKLYNHGMFEEYISQSYYSFDYDGWHFIVLNSTQICNNNYCIDEEQIDWLKNDLAQLKKETPIVVSVHVPFLSVYYPVVDGEYKSTDTFTNFKEVWDMFENNNLKLVLQGHMHLYEEIKVKNVQFITGGAVSAAWWGGSYYGTEEGYLLVSINGDSFNWEYVDYGWQAE
jgi:3',5'-cyclic AMP phosphodiesterase CpdA